MACSRAMDELREIEAIKRLKYKYMRCLDQKGWAELAECFTEDATTSYGGGKYAFYAHILAGTITVKLGERVRPGQTIGLLGNSGNSDAPHLHFHLGDQPSPLGTEGLPFVIDQYEKLGVATANFMAQWKPAGLPESRRGELPLQNHIVRFRP